MKKLNASGEKAMVKHQATVRAARKELTKEAGALKKGINKKMTHALSQDAQIQRDMKRSDKRHASKR